MISDLKILSKEIQTSIGIRRVGTSLTFLKNRPFVSNNKVYLSFQLKILEPLYYTIKSLETLSNHVTSCRANIYFVLNFKSV